MDLTVMWIWLAGVAVVAGLAYFVARRGTHRPDSNAAVLVNGHATKLDEDRRR